MPRLLPLLLILTLLTACGGAKGAPAGQPAATLPAAPAAQADPLPASSTDNAHPRLWLTPDGVMQLRGWATADNPLWADGLLLLAERARADMDAGRVPADDCGGTAYEEYPTEMYAELFAFLALIHPDAAARADYASRGRALLMHVIGEAAKGPASKENFNCNGSRQYPPFRHPEFFTADRDRARYHGEAFALSVDWLYPALSAADKTAIRQVFLRWSEEIITQGYHHPQPVGMVNDPALLADRQQVRFAGNNYFAAHMRNLGLMALALDPADDPDGALRGYLTNAQGAYLYLFNHLLETDARGGLLPEGFEYSPQTAAYAVQFLWALQSSGSAGAAEAVNRDFWAAFVAAYLHSLSPAPVTFDRDGELLAEYQPAWYGDSQDYRLPDFINVWGALAALLPEQAEAIRWAAQHTAPGGAARLTERVRNPTDFREAILGFMLFDPQAAPAADPRAALGLEFSATGLNRVFSRTGWDADAAWLNYRLGWNSIDHQMADGNHFEWYRRGEWLTKGRAGYANIAEGIASSEFYNTVTVGNDRPDRSDDDWRIDLWQRGSQWNLVSDDNPTLRAYVADAVLLYVTGDATPLYNSSSEGVSAVTHVSRSLLWLKPDLLVIYDRAETRGPGYVKRWWLQLAAPPAVQGAGALATTPGGQQLVITALLPEGAQLQPVNRAEAIVEDAIAHNEPMTVRLMSEAANAPPAARFLHVLQAADAGAATLTPLLLRSTDGRWEGAAAGDAAILFARDLGQPLAGELRYTAPAGTRRQLISGLEPGAGYTVQVTATATGVTVSVQPGGAAVADEAGVLRLED
ncbi:MAG: hypothetical protein ABTQ73_08465 [Caldilineales bacterium]